MYSSIIVPWSPDPSEAEETYRTAGLVRTQGTIYLIPPNREKLMETYNAPPKAQSRMSAGAVALCKHFERGGASSEHGKAHLYWPLPRGSNDNKTKTAADVLDRMLNETVWRNVMMLHHNVAVYEVRNAKGYGMRWTLECWSPSNDNGKAAGGYETAKERVTANDLVIQRVLFRGFLEPIEGLDHELDELS